MNINKYTKGEKAFTIWGNKLSTKGKIPVSKNKSTTKKTGREIIKISAIYVAVAFPFVQPPILNIAKVFLLVDKIYLNKTAKLTDANKPITIAVKLIVLKSLSLQHQVSEILEN